MAEVVHLWVYLSSTPLFGLTATVVSYVLAYAAYERLARAPWANPVLWSVVIIGAVLIVSDTSYPTYFAGAQFIHVLLGPAVVALAWPLWQRRAELRRRGTRVLAAALTGGAVTCATAVLLARWLGLPHEIVRSLAPKSITAPVAMGVASHIGGIPELTAVFAVLTGILGALGGRYVFALARIEALTSRGFALGTVSHGIGAARALQVDADAGAYAGMALGLQALLGALLMPLVFRWLS